MPVPSPGLVDIYTAAMEERVMRLEELTRETSVQVAQQTTRLEYVVSKVDSLEGLLGQRIDHAMDRVMTAIVAQGKQIEAQTKDQGGLVGRFDKADERLKKIEEIEAIRRSRWGFIKGRLMLPLFLVVVGVSAGKWGEILWGYFGGR